MSLNNAPDTPAHEAQPLIRGLVVKAQSGFFTIETERGPVVSRIPKKLRYKRRKQQQTEEQLVSSIAAVGDWVLVRITDESHITSADEVQVVGIIEEVEPRKSVLSRARPVAGVRQMLLDREQVLVANADQVIFIFAAREPEPNRRKLDRLLAIAELNELPAIICINKIDLVDSAEMETLFADYVEIGYPVIYTSAEDHSGIDTLSELLKDKVSVFSGSSGVGKSSLLNAVQAGLGIEVGEVSEATTKGMHTTRYPALYKLDIGGYVADTPGIRGVALFNVEPSEVDSYFREIAPLVADCQFGDCTHRNEPGCAVKNAVEEGRVSAERYDSYLRLYEEHEALYDDAYR